ncbi:mechanosensitive ion channel [Flavobacteriaceae bacterium]|jgi:small-conductance mechanosensitive channel|uniref:mechanosensitive ion channel family protein n=1 Tax=Candidatus Arcticimaribacter forsetii TaxID=2820661 RepID=UPI002076E90D|nr:mechanosensitive ion channel domain-containing protein [Candidatus Arcticimaribacter forsetii]MCH1539053.1 mechanosensitive ion channel [Flavobacteriaceae bacterium]MDB2345675.1 mechanosensitive ion channel [Flavobacteriaceae bacterium]MDB2456747.1 mechanosensitive ion channel [Flavobacteriaceae bacterium]MDB4674776.1 mechanosensitive ion channel [Flavobacteriaceae bacterium]MDB4715738.1 mechanosensitive ion channel [Flavobacteriaceae bacterium]
MQHFFDFFNYQISLGSSVSFSLKSILIILAVFVLTKYFLRLIKKLVFRTLNKQAQYTFKSIFSFFNYFIYLIVILITFENIGVNVTGIFAASAALLVGVGLALQTFIQDIISGVFIIADQTVHVGDIIQLDGQVGKIENITLRTTRAVTIDNKVLIIPNHKFLTSVLYNWTENGTLTRENIHIGVAYGSDLNLVKQLLIDLSLEFNEVVREPKPDVLFNDFGDSALDLKLTFTINNSFSSNMVKSAIRYRIYEVFNENNIEIPFPQRTVWMNKS